MPAKKNPRSTSSSQPLSQPAAASSATLAGERGAPRESSKRSRLFQGILNSTSDGILAVSLENEVLFANDRFIEMWMIPQEIMASKDDNLLLGYVLDQLSDPQGFLQKVQDLYHSAEESFDTLYFKNGRVFERLSRPMLEGMELQGRVWSFRDITRRRHIEDALEASEAELRALFASMQDVVLVIDREGVYRKIAPTNPGLLVRPPEELLGKTLKDVFPTEQAKALHQIVRQVLDTKQTSRIEYELTIGSRNVWFQTTISPLDADGTLWVAHDITERKQAEEKLGQERILLRTLIDNLPDRIYVKDVEGRKIISNIADLQASGGKTMDYVIGKTDFDTYPPELAQKFWAFDKMVIDSGTSILNYEEPGLDIQGNPVWVLSSKVPLLNISGKVIGLVGVGRDISERKQAEEELHRAQEALEEAHRELQRTLEFEKMLACTDGLTGLTNRRHFFELADREMRLAIRHQYPLAFLMFDLDHFKQVNDTLGHTTGDNLLKIIAQTASAQVRATDVVARYGGDEFIIMLPHASAQQALPIAEHIRAHVAAISMDAFRDDKEQRIVTLSIGIADAQLAPPYESAEHVIQRADKGLYRAKHSGRNCTVIFGQDEL